MSLGIMHDVNYMYSSSKVGRVVCCKYCGCEHEYYEGEMVYSLLGFGQRYEFCSYNCRARFKKLNPKKVNHGYNICE